MIVFEQDISDAASTSDTLVSPATAKIPRFYIPLVYLSILISHFCFTFVLVDVATEDFKLAIPTMLAYILLLPYLGAALLLKWLQRHQTDSIFPFSPTSRLGIAYSFFLVLLWNSSTVMSAFRMYSVRRYQHWESCSPDPNDVYSLICLQAHPRIKGNWPAIIAITTSSVQLLLMIAITCICWAHRQKHKNVHALPSHSNRTPPPATLPKVVTA